MKPTIFVLSVSFIISILIYGCSSKKNNLEVKEEFLLNVPNGINWNYVRVSPDGKRIAFAAEQDGKWTIVSDTIRSKEYDGFLQEVNNFWTYWYDGDLVFSPDSKRFGYAAYKSGKWFAIVDNKEMGPYDEFEYGSLIFSPDNKHFAYIVKEDSSWLVIKDGKSESIRYTSVKNLVFSPDSKRFAYLVEQDGDWKAVIDGNHWRSFDDINNMHFSPDSRCLAYWASLDDKFTVIVDTFLISKEYDAFSTTQFLQSADGSRITSNSGGDLIFSPDSKHIGYTGRRLGKWFVVIDEKESNPWDEVGEITFSENGNQVVYGAWLDGKGFIVTDSECGPSFDYIGKNSIKISSDGKKILYAVGHLRDSVEKYSIIINDTESNDYDNIIPSSTLFSPDSKRNAFIAKRGAKSLLVVDGNEVLENSEIYGPWFTPDSKQIISIIKKMDLFHFVINGYETRGYHRILDIERVTFNTSNSFNFFAVRNNQFLKVEVKIRD